LLTLVILALQTKAYCNIFFVKTNRIIWIAILAVLATITYYSLTGKQSLEKYTQELLQERKEKDLFMQSNSGSPFVVASVPFQPLKYFDPNYDYRIVANLQPATEKKVIVVTTNDGLEKRYLPYGYAEFTLHGEKCKLLILEVMDSGPYRGTLFLAFADATSANETYGAGRYLDVKKTPGASTITLDFNQAYNPYCAYADSFSCPFPPKENVLKIPIRAGEKSFH
jgi:uncharacterized protein (DUF1684 family)